MMQVRAKRAAAVRKQWYRSNRASAVRFSGDLYHSNIDTGAAIYDLHLVNGSEEN